MSLFHELWEQFQGEAAGEPMCPLAREFSAKVEGEILSRLKYDPTRQEIAQAKFDLSEEFHLWRRSIAAEHKREVAHTCVLEVYLDVYDRVHTLYLLTRRSDQLVIDGPEPTLPAPVIEERVYEIQGIALGQKEP